MTEEQKAAELARLNRLLEARDGKLGYLQNVEAIKAEIVRIEAAPVDE